MDIAIVDGNIPDHVQVDDVDSYLRVENLPQTLDDSILIKQSRIHLVNVLGDDALEGGSWLFTPSLRGEVICWEPISPISPAGWDMSVTEKTRRALKDFGLTEYEVKAYVA